MKYRENMTADDLTQFKKELNELDAMYGISETMAEYDE